MQVLGIDLGTSSVKVILADERGKVLATATRAYPCEHPHSGWSEQNPEDWYRESLMGVKECLASAKADPSSVSAMSFCGQMHGLVVLDEDDTVVRPAILWNDGRSTQECIYLNEHVGRERLLSWCANIAFPGFTAPKVLWLRRNEANNFARMAKLMLPKDYLAYKLTGAFCTDVSDASGTLLFDVRHRRWQPEMLERCGIDVSALPQVHESYEAVGTLRPDVASVLGLRPETLVVAGGGDNAVAAVGCGVVHEGQCLLSIGTSGTVITPSKRFRCEPHAALHSFADATGGYYLMGCILSAASAYTWWNDVLGNSVSKNLERVRLGDNPVMFLPYLMGERSPINDAEARGAFLGMSLDTRADQMTQAVMEGVAFALRDSFERTLSTEMDVSEVSLCGGGSRNALWVRIVASVLGREVFVLDGERGPGLGSCILGLVAAGAYESVSEACASLPQEGHRITPDESAIPRYEEAYESYRHLYPSLRDFFHERKMMLS